MVEINYFLREERGRSTMYISDYRPSRDYILPNSSRSTDGETDGWTINPSPAHTFVETTGPAILNYQVDGSGTRDPAMTSTPSYHNNSGLPDIVKVKRYQILESMENSRAALDEELANNAHDIHLIVGDTIYTSLEQVTIEYIIYI